MGNLTTLTAAAHRTVYSSGFKLDRIQNSNTKFYLRNSALFIYYMNIRNVSYSW